MLLSIINNSIYIHTYIHILVIKTHIFQPSSPLLFNMVASVFLAKWPKKLITFFISIFSSITFLSLDFLDTVLCVFFKIIDGFLEGEPSSCYCRDDGGKGRENEVSESLFGRRNVFREMGLYGFFEKWEGFKRNDGGVKGCNGNYGKHRWSDCGCENCVLWMRSGDQKLHVVVREPSEDTFGDGCEKKQTENVIFLHGFLSSSSFWTETIFPNMSGNTNRNHKLFAIDLLGFGKSPKPRDSAYTLKDHVEMIEKSVIFPFEIESFHIVAHSMGCLIALALAAKYADSIKSITLVAPPYFPCPKDGASLKALDKLAGRNLWPPLLFGSAVMSWYEHLGRCVCFVICRNHRTWESILKLLTGKRDLPFMFMDLTRHTHHSAWHTMHNVICGGAKLMDGYLEILKNSRVYIHVIQGSRDAVVPLECSQNVKIKVPEAEIQVITGANHSSVIIGREKVMALDLESIWENASDKREKVLPENC